MADKDIFKSDNILIRTGFVLGLLAIPIVSAGARSTGGLILAILFALSPVAMLVTGYMIRAKEKRYIAIWRILETAMEVRVEDLIRSTGFTRADVQGALAAINSRGLAFFVWSTESDTIVDGRLGVGVVIVDRCPSCGAAGAQRAPVGMGEAPRCSHCGVPFPADTLNRLKLDAMKDLREGRSAPAAKNPESKLNVPLFAVLAVFCWPVALVYYMRTTRR